MCGRAINKKINDKVVDKLFIMLMAVIILINIYNAVKIFGVNSSAIRNAWDSICLCKCGPAQKRLSCYANFVTVNSNRIFKNFQKIVKNT